MVGKINGQLIFCYSCPETKIKKNRKKNRYLASLLCLLIGIFLLPKIAYLSSITAEKIIELTNKERKNTEINILTANQLLTKAAYDKANVIFETKKFQHNIDDRKFSSWIKEAGYEYSYVGENLAIDFTTSEGIIKAWNNSELHKKNILNPRFTEIGVATLEGNFEGNNSTLVVQIFGEPVKNKIEGQVAGVDLDQLTKQSANPTIESNISTSSTLIAQLSNYKKNNLSLYLNKINKLGSTPSLIISNQNENIIIGEYFFIILYIMLTIIFTLFILPIIIIDIFYFINFPKKYFNTLFYAHRAHKRSLSKGHTVKHAT